MHEAVTYVTLSEVVRWKDNAKNDSLFPDFLTTGTFSSV